MFYSGSLVIKNGTLDKLLVPTGYVAANGNITSNGQHVYFVKDHLGSIRATVAQDGTVLERYWYGPYGDDVPAPGQTTVQTGTTDNPYRFSGKERTPADYDFGARRYLPFHIPRWTTQDPLAEKYYSISPYAYCAADPVNLVDPEGDYILALNAESIEVFKNMLSEEELKYVSFDDNGFLDNSLIASYSGESILLTTIQTLAKSDLIYDFTLSDNDGKNDFYEKGTNGDPNNYYYGLTRIPGAIVDPSPDKNVHIYTARFLNPRERARNLGHELLGHGYFYELSRKDASVYPFHTFIKKDGKRIYDEECGIWVTELVLEQDQDAPLERWIRRVEEQIYNNYDRREK